MKDINNNKPDFEKVNIDGIELSYSSVADHISYVHQLFRLDGFHSIEEVGMDALEIMEQDPRVRKALMELDLALIGETGILTAAGLDTVHRKFDVENLHFCKELMFYLEEQGKTIFVLGGDQRTVDLTTNYFRGKFPQLNIIGGDVYIPEVTHQDDADEESEDVVNEINSVGPDVILSVLPSPEQEIFLNENHTKISASVWYGLGNSMFEEKSGIADQWITGLRIRQLKKKIDTVKG